MCACVYSLKIAGFTQKGGLCHWSGVRLFFTHGVHSYDRILLAGSGANQSGSDNGRLDGRELGGTDIPGISPSLIICD